MNRPRHPKETYEEYRKALPREEQLTKFLTRGTIVWNSTEKGTYVKPKENTK